MSKTAVILICIVCLVAGLVAGAVAGRSIAQRGVDEEPPALTVNNPDDGLGETDTLIILARKAAAATAARDFETLSKMTHSEKGLLFSPYATISTESSRRFTSSEVAELGTDTSLYIWGVYDGSGEPIELTVDDYFLRFVYSGDFVSAPVIGVDYVVRSGNSLENLSDVFPDARYIDLYIPPSGQYESMDWQILRFVFENENGDAKLVAIVHSEWTI